MPPLPDWRLPPGVARGLWDYLHDPLIARNYDESLAGSAVFAADWEFVQTHLDRPGRLIDLGCGTGRLLVRLAQRGFWVLGVDLSEEMLTAAAAKAAAAGVPVHLLKANLVELTCLADGSFDHAACMFSTLGMVAGTAERRRALDHAARLLRPGGKLILHVHNRWFNLRDPQGRKWLLRNWLGSLTGREQAGDRVMPVHQGIAGLTLHIFSRREIIALLKAAGFRVLEVRPVGTGEGGWLRYGFWFPSLRAQGYLIAAQRMLAIRRT